MNVTHEIIQMVRKVTKEHKHPMWECLCKTGEKLWVIQHPINVSRDTFLHFSGAGFGEVMDAMKEGDRLSWKQFPIQVEMSKDGDFWRLVGVLARIEGQVPDATVYKPDLAWWKVKAVNTARRLINDSAVVSWDTETTGTDAEAEIISIGAVSNTYDEKLNLYIRPERLDRVVASGKVHGITKNELAALAGFQHAADSISRELWDMHWIGWNIAFDIQMLDMECERTRLEPLAARAVTDVMWIASWYLGLWDEQQGRWQPIKLTEAAEKLQVQFEGDAHNAYHDAHAVMQVVWAMAEIA